MQRFDSITADGAILDAIPTLNLSRLNDLSLNWVPIRSYKICVVAPHSRVHTSNCMQLSS